ncbi:hypothetical protein BSPWISOXPB_10845 [uncultured Gammaproteobacteria bacterium]|nr:hypothetical protein BSPWISOXPB_10845 [uncultured Gammaproteobacteria bacterium]
MVNIPFDRLIECCTYDVNLRVSNMDKKILMIILRDLCINRNNHQKPTFHPLGNFLNPALALLGQGLKKSPIGQKLDFANHPYFMQRSL